MTSTNSIPHQIATFVNAKESQVNAAIALLDEGSTVPFISRYRKEATGGLTDTQLRQLSERLVYLREFELRRETIIKSIEEQGKLDSSLKAKIDGALTKAELEDLYLPFKKKRRTKGQLAIEAGLEPLANELWDQPENDPVEVARSYIDASKGYDDEKSVLEAARYILMERFAENADLLGQLRELMSTQGYLCSEVLKSKESEGEKFRDYFDHQELYSKVPGHRALAMFRGRAESILALKIKFKQADTFGDELCTNMVARHCGFLDKEQPGDAWRAQVINFTWRVKLSTHLETELFMGLRARADEEAIQIFADNLRDLMLAAPAGAKVTLGLDPGYRSGVKVALIDATGKVLDHTAIYPHAPQKQWDKSLHTLATLCQKHKVELIAIGNGTASRETEKLSSELIKLHGLTNTSLIVVSEAGASVYSASELAEQEHPDLDVTIRGAVSIARRLQDPLAELVKIDPKAIGVGQYQHDVSQTALGSSLNATVEDCVNSVGVDLDTASSALLSRVAGLTSTLADNIVAYREAEGAFKSRAQLKKVPRLGPKAFEQAAGFLRIREGDNPLDASGVHPEAYPVVTRIEKHTKRKVKDLLGDSQYLKQLDPKLFTDESFGEPTVKDILSELEKPGRDPRPEFKTVKFADGIDSMADLNPGQVLEGQVTNVTAFGAFVDVGVHQDGLVHISALSDTYVKDPRTVVKTGDIVKVKVMQVDAARKRIGLSMRLHDEPEDERDGSSSRSQNKSSDRNNSKPKNQGKPSNNKRASNQNNNNNRKPQTDSPFAESLKAALKDKVDNT